MKRLVKHPIKASTQPKTNPEYEKYFGDDPNEIHTSTAQDLKKGLASLEKIEKDYNDGVITDIQETIEAQIWEENDWDLDDAVTAWTIAGIFGKKFEDIVALRQNHDSDFLAATFKDGTVKYFFNRGVMSQGIKDADTGEVYHFEYGE